MNCEEFGRLLEAYLDGELEFTRQLEVEDHLKHCAVCREKVEIRTEFNSAVRANVAVYQAPPELRSKVRSSLRRESKTAWSWHPDSWSLLTKIAAGVIIIAGAVWLWPIRNRSVEPNLATQAIDDHTRSLLAEHLFDVRSTDQHTVKPWFTGKLDYSPPVIDLGSAGFSLVGGRIDVLDNRPVAAIVYQRRKHYINLFIWPVTNQGINLGAKTDRGYFRSGWHQSGFNYLVVTELNAAEAEEFITQIRDQTK